MITTEFYHGQGLGNQLWVYVVLRALAYRRGLSFGVQHPEKFKGADIFDIDFGETMIGGKGPEGGPPISLPDNILTYLRESQLFDKKTSLDVSRADKRLLNISDGTKFDGVCQSLKYLAGLETHVVEWLRLKSSFTSNIKFDENICVIHVRGGDFLNTMSYLPASYYKNAMKVILNKEPTVQFVAVTDDLKYCKKILPEIKVIGSTPQYIVDSHRAEHHVGGKVLDDFLLIYYAKYLIISSSTFSFWAAYLSACSSFVVAPKYWFGFAKSKGWWSTDECIVPSWYYLDRFGKISIGSDCIQNKKHAEAVPYKHTNYIKLILSRLKRKITAL